MSIVLHIDPDAECCERIGRLLKKGKLVSRSCGSVSDALDVLEAEDCLCAILDVRTGDALWHEALARLRSVSHNLPVVLTTAENSKELEARARIEGVTYYYVKTFSEDELLNAVKEISTAKQKGGKNKMDASRKKILVVDDDPDFQEAIRLILEGAGYRVAQAFNKEDGKQKVASESPDLIILDIMMESMSAGFHFLYEVIGTKEQRKSQIPVLSITSISQISGFKFSPKTDENFFPADDYLAKPVKAEELLERVGALLEKG